MNEICRNDSSSMRNFFLTLFLLVTWTATAQDVTYTLIEDNPDALPRMFVVGEVFGLDGGVSNDLNFYVGGTAYLALTEKLAAEGAARVNYFSLYGRGLGIHMEGGGFLPMVTRRPKKDVPVVLKTTLFAGKDDQDRTYDEVQFINVPGTYLNQFGPRAGLYFKRSAVAWEENFVETPTAFTLMGTYLGFEKLTQAYVKAKVDGEDKYGSGQTRLYADLLVLPIRTLADAGLDANNRPGMLGMRVGMQWNKRPHRTKATGFELHPVYTVEMGTRPYSGFFMTGSVGLILFNL